MKYLLVLVLSIAYVKAEQAIETNTKSECIPECGPNQKCYDSQCICDDDSGNLNCTKPAGDEVTKMKCPNVCGSNAECVNGQCVCKKGYYIEFIDSTDCIASVCPNGCGENYICFNSECKCIEQFADYPNCMKPAPTIESTTTTNSTTIANSPSTTESNTPTNSTTIIIAVHTNRVSTTESTTTNNGTTTTTTPKPTIKPTPKPGKAGLSAWALVIIISLLGAVFLFGGFVLYRYKYRGSYSITPTQRV